MVQIPAIRGLAQWMIWICCDIGLALTTQSYYNLVSPSIIPCIRLHKNNGRWTGSTTCKQNRPVDQNCRFLITIILRNSQTPDACDNFYLHLRVLVSPAWKVGCYTVPTTSALSSGTLGNAMLHDGIAPWEYFHTYSRLSKSEDAKRQPKKHI